MCGPIASFRYLNLFSTMRFIQVIWNTCRSSFYLDLPASPLISFLYTPGLSDSLTQCMAQLWKRKSLFQIGNILDAFTKIVLPFNTLQERYDFPNAVTSKLNSLPIFANLSLEYPL